MDPPIECGPFVVQVDDLLAEIRDRAARKERVLVTTLTKRMAEDLTTYYQELGVRVRYLHSDIDTLERVEILPRCGGRSTCSSGSTCCGKGSICPKSHWWPSSTPTKRASCVLPARSFKPPDEPPDVNGRVLMYAESNTASMQSAVPKPIAAGRCSRRAARNTASRRSRWFAR